MYRKNNEREPPLLPTIPSIKSQTQKPIKDILKDLKERKMMIQSRIKTQQQISDQDQKDENEYHLRERLVTEVPYYLNRNTYYDRTQGMGSLDRINFGGKIHEDEQEEESGRETNVKTSVRKRNSLLEPIVDGFKKEESVPKNRKQLLRQIQDIFISVPVDTKDRTEESIQELKAFLVDSNIFFAKIHDVIATCILKLNRLMWLEKHQLLYRKGEQRHAIYIVLCGRLKIYDNEKNLKKICSAGESLGEELLFSQKVHKSMKESAKAISRCFLVEIKTENYKKMGEQMIKYGYKIVFNEMESIIKRNYITKNWLRGEKERYQKRN